MDRLRGKVAIVTGAAQGIGQATAKLFAAEGAKVVVADIDEQAGAITVQEIRDEGGEATFMRLDVANDDDWSRVVAATCGHYGKLNVLVNNAGICRGHSLEETSVEEWDQVMGINATGVFLGMKHAVEAMKVCNEKCSIVNRSSVDGQVGEADFFAYCASKGAVTIMTKAAALSVAAKGYGIRVNSVHPGLVHTPLAERDAASFGLTTDEYLAKSAALHPIGFVGEPVDIAYLDLYLAADESRWVTGAEFTIDGGYTAQ